MLKVGLCSQVSLQESRNGGVSLRLLGEEMGLVGLRIYVFFLLRSV